MSNIANMKYLSTFLLIGACGASAGYQRPMTADTTDATDATDATETSDIASADLIEIDAADRVEAVHVRLLEPGSGDLQTLRLGGVVGQVETMTSSMRMQVAVTVEGQAQPPVETMMGMILEIRLVRIDSAGMRRTEFTVMDVSVEAAPEIQAQMERSLANLVHMTGWTVSDSRGLALGSHVDIPEGVTPEMRAQIVKSLSTVQQVTAPFPEEPVGVGARWRVTSQVSGTIDYEQITTYQLVERDGNRIVIENTVEQHADGQEPNPGQVANLRGHATGRSVVDLDRLVPVSDAEADVVVEMQVSQPGQPPTEISVRTVVTNSVR